MGGSPRVAEEYAKRVVALAAPFHGVGAAVEEEETLPLPVHRPHATTQSRWRGMKSERESGPEFLMGARARGWVWVGGCHGGRQYVPMGATG